jgi:hypothetical protein
MMLTPTNSIQNLPQNVATSDSIPSTSSSAEVNKKSSTVENLFKPLKIEPELGHQSFTGQTFLEQFVKAAASPGGGGQKDSKEQQSK